MLQPILLRRFLFSVSAYFCFLSLSSGHQLYLQPDEYKTPNAEDLNIWVYDGSFDRSTWAVKTTQIITLEAHGPTGSQSIDQETWEVTKAGSKFWRAQQNFLGSLGARYIRYSSSFTIQPKVEGSYVIGLNITPGRIAMEREAYIHYLEKEAFSSFHLDDLPQAQDKEMFREQFKKSAKTIVQSGARITDNVLQPIGLMAEILPTVHPARIKVGDVVDLMILLNGNPLPGQNVLAGPKAGMFSNSEESGTVYTSNEAGIISLPITEPGTWWLKFIHLQPVSMDEGVDKVDFVSNWGSLTFEVN